MKALALVLAAAGLLHLAGGAQAAPGDLDGSFGTGGVVLTDFGAVNPFEDAADVLVQPDGKIVAAGTSSGCCGDGNFALARYDASGALDPSFGTGGKVLTDLDQSLDVGVGATLQPDGKIIVVGQTFRSTDFDFGIVRYLPDGSLDPSFGTGGVVVQDILGAHGFDTPYAVAVQKDKKIVVAGFTTANGTYDVALVRYKRDGSLDTGFGKHGIALVGVSLGSDDEGHALAIDSKGRLVVAGMTYDAGNRNFLVVRFQKSGKLDTTFGTRGLASVDLGGDDEAWSLAIQPDGKIVAGGSSDANGDSDFALVRLDSKGRLDPTFGTDGVQLTGFGASSADGVNSLVLQPNGSIVAGGGTDASGNEDMALARYGSNGTLDAGFGTGGKVTVNVAGSSNDVVFSLARQADGKIVAGGTTDASSDQDFALARFLP